MSCLSCGESSTPGPSQKYEDASIKSMGYQDDAIQQAIAWMKETSPYVLEQMKEGIENAKVDRQHAGDALAGSLANSNAMVSAAQMTSAPLMEQARTAARLADKSIELQDYQVGQMKENDARWKSVGMKQEDQLISMVEERSSQKYKDQQLGMAMGDVTQGFSNARDQTERSAARMGINPNSGAFGSAMARMTTDQALGTASAKNKMRVAMDQTDLSNKFQLYGGLKGMSGLGQTSAQIATGAINAGTGAVNAGTNAYSAMRSGMGGGGGSGGYSMPNAGAGLGMATQAMGAGMSGYGNLGNMAGGMGQNATGMYNAQANYKLGADKNAAANDPMGMILGNFMGQAGSAAGTAIFGGSDRRLKQDIQRVGVLDNGLPVYVFRYKTGGPFVMGVMADEVEQVLPGAVHKRAIDGEYDAVDYSQLGGAA